MTSKKILYLLLLTNDSILIMWWIILIITVIVGGISLGNKQNKENQARADAMEQALATIPDFIPTTKVKGLMGLFTFATDNEHQKVLILKGEDQMIFKYEDIISVELIEDNSVISQKSTARTIGGALLGGAIAGGVGAIVGGLSGSSKQQNLHSLVKVKVLVRNNPVPSTEIYCYNCYSMNPNMKPVKDNDILYMTGKQQAIRIVDSLSVIIDAVDKALKVQGSSTSIYSTSVADELAKLAVLKDKGVLTDAEFVTQKTKLLNIDNTTGNDTLKLDLPGPNPLDVEFREIIKAEGPLKAMVKYKERMGVDLSTAKIYIDSLL